MNQNAVIAFLSDPASYNLKVSEVERHETHGAIVFLAGNRAYKLKRAVCYPYMDFSTPELRHAMCAAELAVNRKSAPQLYLEVRAIVPGEDGNLRFGSQAEEASAIDWVVVMQRFEQSALLEEMRKRGTLSASHMRTLADTIATYHQSAEIHLEAGGAAGILKVINENVEILRAWTRRPFDEHKIEQFSRLARKAHHRLAGLLEARRKNGFVRRCHGDLHLNNICLIDGTPVLFDAIEFNEDFSLIDVFYDLSFLLMDLDHRKLRPLANVVLNRYLENTRDYDGVGILPLGLACRAGVRAHVTATLADKLKGESAHSCSDDSASLLDDAIGYLRDSPTRLIILGGLSGTGKSTLARQTAPVVGRAPGAIILRSDVIRKKICGVSETDRLPQDGYSVDVNARVYSLIAQRAKKLLAGGHSVIADAVFGSSEERKKVEDAASCSGAEVRAVWLDAPVDVLEQRLSARQGDASDATIEVLHRQVHTVAVPKGWVKLDVSGSPEQSLHALGVVLRD